MSDLDYGAQAESARILAARGQLIRDGVVKPAVAVALKDVPPTVLCGARGPDRHGDTPTSSWLRTRWLHRKTGRVYLVVAFAWDGATDEWSVIHIDPNSPDTIYTRSLHNWNQPVDAYGGSDWPRMQRIP